MPPRDELEAEYQNHSMRQIAEKYGVGETVVWKRLKEFGIKLHDYENGGHRLKPGRIFSVEHRRNISRSMRGKVGPLNRNWKGGKTAENLRLRGSIEYREWKASALLLRGYKCQECGTLDRTICECCGTQIVLHVHHVKSFAKFPDSRFDLTIARYSARKAIVVGIERKPSESCSLPTPPLRLRPACVRALRWSFLISDLASPINASSLCNKVNYGGSGVCVRRLGFGPPYSRLQLSRRPSWR
jgi:hypothetical protein